MYFETNAQVMQQIEEFQSNQLEDLAEVTEEDSEDDYNLQQIEQLKKQSVSINGSADELNQLPLLDALQISNIINYRKLMGDFVSIYELQAVPGFDLDELRRLEPFIRINGTKIFSRKLTDRFTGGSASLVVRPALVIQPSEGFVSNTPASRFVGGRSSILIRYKYQFKNLLQYGITFDKDAGEALFNRSGLNIPGDFRSAHLFIRQAGLIKTLAIGDYTVNLGQGLIHWQSQAFKKSSTVLNTKRQSEVLRPYQSAGEFNFLRGVALTMGQRALNVTGFISQRRLTANTVLHEDGMLVVTSLNSSGLHRTSGERADKNAVRLTSSGGGIHWSRNSDKISLNIVGHQYSLPIRKRDQPYNIYSVKGRFWLNASIDFSYTISNYHFFGEAAIDKNLAPAVLNGFVASLHRNLDLTVVYRNLGTRYQSLYGNAFTENTSPGNETGLYLGMSFRPREGLRVDVHNDMATFRWLKYRVDAPSSSMQQLLQVTWKPGKYTEYYSRIRVRTKALNYSVGHVTRYPEQGRTFSWRNHFSHRLDRKFTIRNRVEFCLFQPAPAAVKEYGYSFFTDMLFKPPFHWYTFNIRFQYFDCDSYNTRIYNYENDVPMSTSIPALYGTGVRAYANFTSKRSLKWLRSSTLALSLKVAHSVYGGSSSIGTGVSEIKGNAKTDLRFQAVIASL
jgi:hypothetical protein